MNPSEPRLVGATPAAGGGRQPRARNRRRWHRTLFVVVAVLGVALGYALWPRRAHLRQFDPKAVARLETGMWKHYYDREYFKLCANLYRLNREQYGFSPWDSVSIAYYAAKAAAVFQPTRSRLEARRAQPLLARYFQVIATGSGEPFDAAKAAALELEWWQLRREDVALQRWSEVVASVTVEVYGASNEPVHLAAVLRAQMMQYLDERRVEPMAPSDWRHIEEGLVRSYEALKSGVNP